MTTTVCSVVVLIPPYKKVTP